MKKYFLGLGAIVCALAFSAFTKPFAVNTFKLLTDPVVANVVNDPAQWKTTGSTFGQCLTVQNDIACTIKLNTAQSAYFHTDGTGIILNTFSYADAQSPKQDYLSIVETTGLGNDRIISSITPMHYNGTSYVSASLGSDLSFENRKD